MNTGATFDWKQRLAENVARVRAQIAEAANRAGKKPTDVCLVAVTKYAPLEITAALLELGCLDLGESRPQVLWDKAAQMASSLLGSSPRWHLIGQLQRNKLSRTLRVPGLTYLHAVDNWRLLTSLEQEAQASAVPLNVLLEIKISPDPTKHGFLPDELEPRLEELAALQAIRVKGLMSMASLNADVDEARREFAQLRALRDRWARCLPAACSLPELSMGMSGDFEPAIWEGSTMVRIGSALFDGVLTG